MYMWINIYVCVYTYKLIRNKYSHISFARNGQVFILSYIYFSVQFLLSVYLSDSPLPGSSYWACTCLTADRLWSRALCL